MKYFIDTEFREQPNTIDFISIGIKAEDGREYYSISKDFNIKKAWKSYQLEQVSGDMRNRYPNGMKVYWLRENVLRPIFEELLLRLKGEEYKANQCNCSIHKTDLKFNKRNFKKLIKKYGKVNKQIAQEIIKFTKQTHCIPVINGLAFDNETPKFYAYYADYDWVVFCWLFGKMIDLPDGFPMYCVDLKQTSDELYEKHKKIYFEKSENKANKSAHFLNKLSDHLDYPKQTDEHNALADARWNFALYEFIIKH